MSTIVFIKQMATGEEALYPLDETWQEAEFQWCDNNYSCDCNRALFFGRVKNIGEMDVRCGESGYRIRVTETGREIFKEDGFDAVHTFFWVRWGAAHVFGPLCYRKSFRSDQIVAAGRR